MNCNQKFTINSLVTIASNKLKDSGINDFSNDALELFLFGNKMSKADYCLHARDIVKFKARHRYNKLINKRCKRVPLQYITKIAPFYGFEFFVNKNVLIPRFDSEIVVSSALNLINNYNKRCIDVLDMCTGSGVLGIALAKTYSNLNITLADISSKSLRIAKRNANKHQIKANIIRTNMFEKINQTFDMIVCNPPYVSLEEYETLEIEVRNFEPRISLVANENGLEFYKELSRKSYNYLNEGGYLVIEIGAFMQKDILEIFDNNKYKYVNTYKDLQGFDRCMIFKKNNFN